MYRLGIQSKYNKKRGKIAFLRGLGIEVFHRRQGRYPMKFSIISEHREICLFNPNCRLPRPYPFFRNFCCIFHIALKFGHFRIYSTHPLIRMLLNLNISLLRTKSQGWGIDFALRKSYMVL